MFQFMKANKMFTAAVVIIIILLVALVTGFAAHYPALSLGLTLVGLVFGYTAFYNQLMRPRSE